jgi:hypothetical protein
MGHRCRDDFWLWAALFVAAANDNSRRSSCCSDERQRDCYDYDWADRSDRTPIQPQNRRKSVLVVGAVGIAVVLVAIIASNSHSSESQSIQRAPLNLAVALAETPSETPIEPSATEPAQPLIEESAPIADAEPPLLQASDVVAPIALVPSLEPAALDSLFFDVGSSRPDVIAAQGRPPTYAAHHDRTLWWGSSRVEFDQDGKVRSWLDGTPALNAYRR